MENREIIDLVLGGGGALVVLTLLAAAMGRALVVLHRQNQDLHRRNAEAQQKYIQYVESERDFYLEAQKVLTRAIVVMERFKGD